MDVIEVKKNCKNLILNNLNNYDYITAYVNTQTSKAIFDLNDESVDKFVSDINTEIKEEHKDLYCDLKVSAPDNLSGFNFIILKIEKFKKEIL